jgi:hypothetical protein
MMAKSTGEVEMSRCILGIFLALFLMVGHAPAKVYVWTDESGIRHYTDTPPPEGAEVIKTFEEVPSTPEPQPRQPVPEIRPSAPEVDAPEPSDGGTPQRVPVGELAIGKANRKEAEDLIAQERKRLNERLVVLEAELERAQTEQYRGSSYSREEWAARIEQLQSDIREENLRSERRIAEIKKKYGLD